MPFYIKKAEIRNRISIFYFLFWADPISIGYKNNQKTPESKS
jgi:hypothetical protein